MEYIYPKIDPTNIDLEAADVSTDDIRSFHSWVSSPNEEGLTVAVVDSGIDENHPVFEGIEIEHQDMTGQETSRRDLVSHGTACAGLIVQLAPIKKLIDVRVFGREGRTTGEVLMRAYDHLLKRADEIDLANFSLGTSRKVDALDARQNQLVAKGIRTVSAAGNSGQDTNSSPAAAKRSFSAGALTIDGEMTDFSAWSNEHNSPTIAALGKNIRLARAEGTSMGQVLDENWVMASGTSFACPITLAALANYMAYYNRFSRSDFTTTADEITEAPTDGQGILDLEEAMEAGKLDKSEEGESTITTHMGVQQYGNKNIAWFHSKLFEPGSYEVTKEGNNLKVEDK